MITSKWRILMSTTWLRYLLDEMHETNLLTWNYDQQTIILDWIRVRDEYHSPILQNSSKTTISKSGQRRLWIWSSNLNFLDVRSMIRTLESSIGLEEINPWSIGEKWRMKWRTRVPKMAELRRFKIRISKMKKNRHIYRLQALKPYTT